MTTTQVQHHLELLLIAAGCRRYSAREARAHAVECWRFVRDDAIAHGGSSDEPFFNFILVENVGVFTFFGSSVEIFVLQGSEEELRSRFDPLPMVDTEDAKRILAEDFNKRSPDLILEPSLSREWLARAAD